METQAHVTLSPPCSLNIAFLIAQQHPAALKINTYTNWSIDALLQESCFPWITSQKTKTVPHAPKMELQNTCSMQNYYQVWSIKDKMVVVLWVLQAHTKNLGSLTLISFHQETYKVGTEKSCTVLSCPATHLPTTSKHAKSSEARIKEWKDAIRITNKNHAKSYVI